MIANKKLGLKVELAGGYYNVSLIKRDLLFLSIGSGSDMTDTTVIRSGCKNWCAKNHRACATWVVKTINEMIKEAPDADP